MNKKASELHKRTLKLLQHSTTRMAELHNILMIAQIYFEKEDVEGLKNLEKRILQMETFPSYAGKNEKHKEV